MITAGLHKRVVALVLMMCMCITCVMPAFADEYPTQVKTVAEAYVVYDVNSGQVIMSKDMDTSRAPASITKIMTALLVCEHFDDLSQEIIFTQAALGEMTETSSDLTPRAVVNEKMTVENALYGMYLCSANECAAQLGISVAGSTAAFAEMMNKRAEEIGCTGTHFANAHGLDNEQHYTTPHDMALIFAEALKNEKFYKLATTVDYVIPTTNMCVVERQCQMGHKMVNGAIVYEGVFAGKTGNTLGAGRTLATAAKFGDRTVITVIMHSTEASFYDDTVMLLDYAKGYYAGQYSDMSWKNIDMDMTVQVPNNLAVRDYPSTKGSNVIARLDNGNVVHVHAKWSNWAAITFNGQTAFVCTDFLVDSTGQTLPAETFDNSVVETTAAPTTEAEVETVPEDIKNLGETTTAAETTQEAANKKGAGSNILLAVILIILIVGAAAAAIIFIIRKAIHKERELYREYYKDNDKLFYEDGDDASDDSEDVDDEDDEEGDTEENEGISDEDALFLDDDELYDDDVEDDSEDDADDSEDDADDSDEDIDDDDADEDDADDDVSGDVDDDTDADADEDDLDEVEIGDIDGDDADEADLEEADTEEADAEVETVDEPDDEPEEPLDAEDAGKAYVQALLQGEAVHATARKIKRDRRDDEE